MRAVFEKAISKAPKCEQILWRLIPCQGESALATHVITVSVRSCFARETMVFWANEAGNVTDWIELARTEPGEHVACLLIAGIGVARRG